MKRLHWIAAALAAPLFLAGEAKALYAYGTTIVNPSPNTVTFNTPTTNVTFLPAAGIGEPETSGAIKLANFPTTTGQGYSGTVNPVTINVTITDSGGGSAMLVVNGSMVVTSGLAVFTEIGGTLTGSTNDFTYTFIPALNNVALPTASGAGSFNMFLQITPVPEPASMALVGVGGLLLVAPRLRRLVRRIGQSEQG